MINMSECFSMIGQNGCMDVATSLGMQGIDNSMPEISIPIYGPFFLKILIGQNSAFICDNLQQVSALQHLNQSCGTVAVTINLCEMDILTLVGGVLTFTPNTGMNCFLRLCAVDIVNIAQDLLPILAEAAGIPIPDGLLDGVGNYEEFLTEVLQKLFDILVEHIDNDMGSNGINVRELDELWNFFMEVKESGEMIEMQQYRSAMGAFIL